MSAAIGNRSSPNVVIQDLSNPQLQHKQLTLFRKPLLLSSKRRLVPAGIATVGKGVPGSATLMILRMPAQRPAEVLGTPTHAQLTRTINQPTLCSFARHWNGQRQFIAVTCIAEHA